MKILPFPELRQTYEYDCGAKALQAVLAYYAIERSEEIIINELGTNRNGTKPHKIEKVAKKYGLNVDNREMNIKEVKKYIKNKIPVILLIQAWAKNEKIKYKNSWNNGHYVVAIGYDKKNLYFEDPYSFLRTYLSYKEVEERWHHRLSPGKNVKNMGIAIHGKKPQYNLLKTIPMK